MTKKLGEMNKEEKMLSYEIKAREETDPRLRERLRANLMRVRKELALALEDPTVPPEVIDELDYKIRTYGKMLSVTSKMDIVEAGIEDAFAEANVTAQLEQSEKL